MNTSYKKVLGNKDHLPGLIERLEKALDAAKRLQTNLGNDEIQSVEDITALSGFRDAVNRQYNKIFQEKDSKH